MRVEVRGRGLDVGRDTHLDWTLPDPSRTVSSKHFEIRFRDGGYWLHDVSTNGTYVNGAQYRLDAPYLLRDGDRLSIGPYLIAVEVEGQTGVQPGAAAAVTVAEAAAGDVWGEVGEAAAPDDRSAYQTAARQEPPPDFLDFASFIAPTDAPGSSPPSTADDWLTAAPPLAPAVPRPTQAPLPPQPLRPPIQAEIQPLRPVTAPPRHPTVPPPAEPPAVAPSQAASVGLLQRIARAAGIPEQTIVGRDPDALADEIGVALRLMAQNLQVLLASRAEF